MKTTVDANYLIETVVLQYCERLPNKQKTSSEPKDEKISEELGGKTCADSLSTLPLELSN
jgi:hypothetical protein